jgi:hypothetical protein
MSEDILDEAKRLTSGERDLYGKPAACQLHVLLRTTALALEATRDLATREITVETPLEPHSGSVLTQPIVVVPILRAGIAIVACRADVDEDIGGCCHFILSDQGGEHICTASGPSPSGTQPCAIICSRKLLPIAISMASTNARPPQ